MFSVFYLDKSAKHELCTSEFDPSGFLNKMHELTDLSWRKAERANTLMQSRRWTRHTQQRAHVQGARTCVSLQNHRAAVERAPPRTSIIKSYSQSHCSGYWQESLCFNMNTIKTDHDIQRTRTGSLTSGLPGDTTDTVTKRRSGGAFVLSNGRPAKEHRKPWPTRSVGQHSCPYASPQEGDAQYMYIVNEGWYLHPILVTFSKALRFILL